MTNDPSRQGPVLYAISVSGSLVLIVIGTFFSLNHTGAATAYGVALSGCLHRLQGAGTRGLEPDNALA